jgi:hypothetical protein
MYNMYGTEESYDEIKLNEPELNFEIPPGFTQVID